MKASKLLILGLLLSACAPLSPQKRGTISVADIGAKQLTEKGDQLMGSGVYATKEVSADFAEGYEKGLSDAVKQEYWSMQNSQRWVRFIDVVRK